MKKNTLEGFKKAVKEKYEAEKLGVHSSFLWQPSRAKLRNLCFEILKENPNPSDLSCFQTFLGFEFNPNGFQKLKTATDKFRPIETFFKRETDLIDVASVNMAAVLVGFSPRPYLKFAQLENVIQTQVNSEEKITDSVTKPQSEISTIWNTNNKQAEAMTLVKSTTRKNFVQKRPLYWIASLVTIVTAFYGYRALNSKECMQWNSDHYEIVHCKTEQLGLLANKEKTPINNQLLTLRKINVCDTTTFFKHDQPQIWYCKKDKKVEFFNGPGFHPENGKPLKPITDYMINKYVLKED